MDTGKLRLPMAPRGIAPLDSRFAVMIRAQPGQPASWAAGQKTGFSVDLGAVFGNRAAGGAHRDSAGRVRTDAAAR